MSADLSAMMSGDPFADVVPEEDNGPSTFMDEYESTFAQGGEETEVPEQTIDPDAPDADLAKGPTRARNAVAYENKVKGILGFVATALLPHEGTGADAAAIYQYGANFSKTWGDVAAKNKEVARVIDALTTQTDSPYLSAAMASLPLVLQVVRNHEPELQPVPRGIKIPGTKKTFRIPFKVGLKLGRLRGYTHDPDALYDAVMSDPKIQAQLAKRGIKLPKRGRRA